MSKKIAKLSKELINLIAAGEVVERPASVIKELMENSIDAGSTFIKIEIKNAGIDEITLTDDGIGIPEEEIELAIEQHATSKILDKNDLANIFTLGFRGEALASISSTAGRFSIHSKTEEQNGIEISRVEGTTNKVKLNRNQRGTTVSVQNLFESIPARKKFLKTTNTELKHIIDTFLNIALVFTHIHFELYSEGKLLYKLTKTEDMLNRIYEIFGKNIAKNLYFSESNELGILGYLGNTMIGKSNNKTQFIFINNRFIKSNLINAAINQGYHGFLHKDLKATYFLFLKLDPANIDINIHPRKLEVKFEDERKIFSLVQNFVKKTLENKTKGEIETRFSSTNSFVNDLSKASVNQTEYKAPTSSTNFKPKNDFTKHEPRNTKVNSAMNFTKEIYSGFQVNDIPRIEKAPAETFLIGRPIQVFNTYIVFEKENEVIFIDQHAAAEKIAFEKLINNLGKPVTKPLLVPEIIDLKNNSEKEKLIGLLDELKNIGIVYEDFGDKTIKIDEVPEILNLNNLRELIEKLINVEDDYQIEESIIKEYNITKETYLRIATVACKGSIKAGQQLNDLEMKNIRRELNNSNLPYNCPHGRPVMWTLTKYELEKNFNRNI